MDNNNIKANESKINKIHNTRSRTKRPPEEANPQLNSVKLPDPNNANKSINPIPEGAKPALIFGGSSSLNTTEAPNGYGVPATTTSIFAGNSMPKVVMPEKKLIRNKSKQMIQNKINITRPSKKAEVANMANILGKSILVRDDALSKSATSANVPTVAKNRSDSKPSARFDFGASTSAGTSDSINILRNVTATNPVLASTTTAPAVLKVVSFDQISKASSATLDLASNDLKRKFGNKIPLPSMKKPRNEGRPAEEVNLPNIQFQLSDGLGSLSKKALQFNPHKSLPALDGASSSSKKTAAPNRAPATSSTLSRVQSNAAGPSRGVPNSTTYSKMATSFVATANGTGLSSQMHFGIGNAQQNTLVCGRSYNITTPSTTTGGQKTEPIARWSCSACTLHNDALRKNCELCDTERPGMSTNGDTSFGGQQQSITVNENSEWRCSACTLLNDDQQMFCECCEMERPQMTANVKNLSVSSMTPKSNPSTADKVNPKKSILLGQCIVCLCEESEFVFVNCGHLCVCKVCVKMFSPLPPSPKTSESVRSWRHECPKCRVIIQIAPIRVFHDHCN